MERLRGASGIQPDSFGPYDTINPVPRYINITPRNYWSVIQLWNAYGQDSGKVLDDYDGMLRVKKLRRILRYYATHQTEIDAEIKENVEALAERRAETRLRADREFAGAPPPIIAAMTDLEIEMLPPDATGNRDASNLHAK